MSYKVYKIVLLLFSLFCTSGLLQAQDFIFSQPFTSPSNFNPALTGLYNGQYRIATNYRNQWSNKIKQPYTNFSGLIDLRIRPFKNNDRDVIAAGFTFYSGKEGEAPVETYKFTFSGAYHKSLDYHKVNTISMGIYYGPVQRGINFNRITFEDQFNGVGFINPTREIFPEKKISYYYFGIGINYLYNTDLYFASFGLSTLHINQPDISPYKNDEINNGEDLLKRSYNLYANVRIPIYYESLFLNPRVVANVQGSFQNYIIGTSLYFPLEKARTLSNMHFGVYSKFGNRYDKEFALYDITALIGLEFHPFVVGFSYDISTRSLATFSSNQGSFELSLTFFGNKNSTEKFITPLF